MNEFLEFTVRLFGWFALGWLIGYGIGSLLLGVPG